MNPGYGSSAEEEEGWDWDFGAGGGADEMEGAAENDDDDDEREGFEEEEEEVDVAGPEEVEEATEPGGGGEGGRNVRRYSLRRGRGHAQLTDAEKVCRRWCLFLFPLGCDGRWQQQGRLVRFWCLVRAREQDFES